MPDVTIDDVTYVYQPNPQHRNRAPRKSQWQITSPEELIVFGTAIEEKWGGSPYYWGLHRPAGGPAYLGVDRDHRTRVFLARFEACATPAVWHGYPVNHRDGRPSSDVLRKWLKDGILPPAKIAKIQARKPCNL